MISSKQGRSWGFFTNCDGHTRRSDGTCRKMNSLSDSVFLFLSHPPYIHATFYVYPVKSFISGWLYCKIFTLFFISLSINKSRFKSLIWFNADLMCKLMKLMFPIFSLLCLQSSGCASTGPQAKGGEVAGHAQPLGQVDDQEIQ